MAKLSDETLITIFSLLRQLAEGMEDASATEWRLFTEYGETARTIGELEELQGSRERLNLAYTRLNRILLRILQEQPSITDAMLNLLGEAIEQGQATVDAAHASVLEVKRSWNLL